MTTGIESIVILALILVNGFFSGLRPAYGPGSGLGFPMHYRYAPATYLLLWFLISPIYLACLLFLTVTMVPTGVVLPAFLAMGAASMLLLIYLGEPTARKAKGQRPKAKG